MDIGQQNRRIQYFRWKVGKKWLSWLSSSSSKKWVVVVVLVEHLIEKFSLID